MPQTRGLRSSLPSSNPRGARPTAAALTVLVSFALALALGEGALRAGQAVMAVRASMAPTAELEPDLIDLPEIDGPYLLVQPYQRSNHRGALYETNGLGFRGPEPTVPKPRGTFRISMLGDSATMGSGVTREQAYPARVEALLARGDFYEKVEVLNLGLPGLRLARSVERRLPLAVDLETDLLVYGFSVDDILGPNYHSLRRVRHPATGSVMLDRAWVLWDYLRDLTVPSGSSYLRELDNNYFHNRKAWDDVERHLNRLTAESRGRGVCAVVFLHPQLAVLSAAHPYTRFYAAIAAEARERGLFVIDALPAFLGKNAESLRRSRTDWSPNAAAQAILAEALASGILELPEACLPNSPPLGHGATS